MKCPHVAVDAIIRHDTGEKEGIVLIERKYPPYKGMLALPGGGAEVGLTLEQNARKEVQEEANLFFALENEGRPHVRSDPKRDPRSHVLSMLYWGRGYGNLKAGDDASRSYVFTDDEISELLRRGKLAFDHADILREWNQADTPIRDKMQRVGVIGRFKPLHKGAAVMLEELCKKSEHLIIGIGSSQGAGIEAKYNARNPFTPQETEDMIHTYLSEKHGNYSIIHVPDFAHISGNEDGSKWRDYVRQAYGTLDCFVSGNEWVRELMANHYPIAHPSDLIPRNKWIVAKGSLVRTMMAKGENWRTLVPDSVADYLVENCLVDRFQSEFGSETLSKYAPLNESAREEMLHAREG